MVRVADTYIGKKGYGGIFAYIYTYMAASLYFAWGHAPLCDCGSYTLRLHEGE